MSHGVTYKGMNIPEGWDPAVVAKDDITRDEFWNDTYLMWELLYEKYGWPEKKKGAAVDGIYVLYSNGRDWLDAGIRYNPYERHGIYNLTDYPENKQNVYDMLMWLKNGNGDQGVPAMTPEDILFVYNNSHGGIDEEPPLNSHHFNVNDGIIYARDFAPPINSITNQKRIFWFGQCYSGGFIDYLKDTKTVIHTAASFDEASWKADDVTRNGSPLPENEIYNGITYYHQEMSFHNLNSQRGKALFEPTRESYAYPPTVNADLNGDNKISIYETWIYEKDHESRPETPQYSDLGNIGSSTFLDYIPQTVQESRVQNVVLDVGSTTSLGNVNIDGQSYQSPYAFVPVSRVFSVGAAPFIYYNETYLYFCGWSDDYYQDHKVCPSAIGQTYSAFYKKRPTLAVTYDGARVRFNWDWLLGSRPKNFLRFELYQMGLGKIYEGTENYFSQNKTINTKTIYQLRAVISMGEEVNFDSNTKTIYPPNPGDPVVAEVNTPDATAFSNGKKIVVDYSMKLHVVFSNNDNVYYTTSIDEGETWTTPIAVGSGKHPAIELTTGNLPTICWNNGNLLYSSKMVSGAFEAPQLIYTGPEGSEISYLSYVLDQNTNNSYLGWVDEGASGSSVLISTYNPSTSATLAPIPIDQGGADAFKSPSLALDKAGNLKTAWSHSGKVYYKDNSEFFEMSDNGIHPIVDTYGDKTTVVWQEEIAPDVYQVVKKTKGINDWSDKQVISYPDGQNADFPVVAAAGQYLYSKNVKDDDYDLIWFSEYDNGLNAQYQNISGVQGGISRYPSVAYKQSWPQNKLYTLWTEEMPDNTKSTASIIIKTYPMTIDPVPLIYIDLGSEESLVYTTQRGGTIYYGPHPNYTVDYHNTQLKYKFQNLDINKRYRVKVTYYHNFDKTLKQTLSVDKTFNTKSKIDPKTVVTEEHWIPNSCLKDGQIEVTITKTIGEYAVCSVIALYEFDRDCDSKSSENIAESSSKSVNIYSYELMQNYPNPNTGKTAIKYQLPQLEKVSLKIYNTLGQVVKTLVSQEQPMGYYNVTWDCKDNTGKLAANGVYFYRLEAGDFRATKKMVVIK